MDRDDSINTSIRLPIGMARWLGQQARVRDTSRSALVRIMVREAMSVVATTEGIGPPSWPSPVAPPLHERTPVRGRPGRLRDRKGRFVA